MQQLKYFLVVVLRIQFRLLNLYDISRLLFLTNTKSASMLNVTKSTWFELLPFSESCLKYIDWFWSDILWEPQVSHCDYPPSILTINSPSSVSCSNIFFSWGKHAQIKRQAFPFFILAEWVNAMGQLFFMFKKMTVISFVSSSNSIHSINYLLAEKSFTTCFNVVTICYLKQVKFLPHCSMVHMITCAQDYCEWWVLHDLFSGFL